VQRALGLTKDDLTQLARNSIEASFASEVEKDAWQTEIDRYVAM